ncbi:MAG: hypothetical protein V3V84_00790 [Candidatus Bathyarchaeia archaeon]
MTDYVTRQEVIEMITGETNILKRVVQVHCVELETLKLIQKNIIEKGPSFLPDKANYMEFFILVAENVAQTLKNDSEKEKNND